MKLPVHEVEQEICRGVAAKEGRVLLKAPTGSGKSTTVPGMVAGEVEGVVLVVQPRRMAARLLAGYVARQRGTTLGEEVGYAVRFDSRYGKKTKILYITDGILQRRLLEDSELAGVGAVVFDEFHERRLSSDLALGRILSLQEGPRPELKVVVMSATLETGDLTGYLAPCEVVETGGRLYPVEVVYRGQGLVQKGGSGSGRRPELWDRVTAAVRSEMAERVDGERILVFLPGLFEIRKVEQILANAGWMKGWEVLPLYSALSPKRQEEALRVDLSRRVILATNVAETSVTIEGVRVVVDSGLARQSRYDPGRGFDSLEIVKISQAAAAQRAGRAGRTGPGKCVRLWSESDQRGRPEFETPEVRRVDLAEAALFLKKAEGLTLGKFRWLDQPEEDRVKEAEGLLGTLGAIDERGELTETGWEMTRWPLPPRLARLISAGLELGCAAEAAFIAAVLQGDGVFKKGGKGKRWEDFLADEREEGLDFAGEWHAVEFIRRENFNPREAERSGILARGAREVWQSFEQIEQVLKRRGVKTEAVHFGRRSTEVRKALLRAFGDRVAVRRDAGSGVCRVAGGRRGRLADGSTVQGARLFLAAEMMEIEGRERVVVLSRCAALEEDWLNGVQETEGVIFDEIQRRVVAVRQRRWRDLVLEEKRGGEVNPDLAAELLAERIVAGELSLKLWDGKVERWIARLQFLSEAMPELELPGFDQSDREAVVAEMCSGAMTYKEVKGRSPWPALDQWLSAAQAEALKSFAPEKIALENGVKVRVNYRKGEAPWVEEKVQRLYGVRRTPVIAQEHRLTIKILAPNQRPWQVTSDLEGFWKTGFPQMKKDLAGRYPKHDWDGGL